MMEILESAGVVPNQSLGLGCRQLWFRVFDVWLACSQRFVQFRGQQVGGRNQSGFVLESGFQPFVVPLRLGVLLAGRAPGTFDENAARPRIALAGLAAFAFAPGDIVARTGPQPGCQLARTR